MTPFDLVYEVTSPAQKFPDSLYIPLQEGTTSSEFL